VTTATPVLLLHDGELEAVRLVLEDLGAELEEANGTSRGPIAYPDRLLVATARLAHSLRIERTLTPSPGRATWVAFVAGDSKTQRSALSRAGFDFLIREPVHPAALRVLLQRALFQGRDTRRAPRVACGHPVRYKLRFWERTATLLDLSLRGCRLLVSRPVEQNQKITVRIPRELAGGRRLSLPGTIVRVSSGDRECGLSADYSVGVRFALRDVNAKSRLRDVLAERVIGPTTLASGSASPVTPPSAAPPSAAPSAAPAPRPAERSFLKPRRSARGKYGKQVTALDGTDAYMILGLDLSVGGMKIERVEGLEVGAKLDLAIQLNAREEPALVEATVVREDGESQAVRFDWISPEAKRRIEHLVRSLPAIEPLQDDAKRVGTILARRVQRAAGDSRS
jgi:hypothetical protein